MYKNIFSYITQIRAYLILIILALFMLGANPFKSQTVAPMDLLVQYPGWQNTGLKVDYINGERSDVLDAKLPIWINAKRSLYRGELPIWNHQRAGKPGLTFTNSLITPAFATFAMIKDDALGFYLSNLINVLIGLIGMFLFLRLFFNTYASIFGAIVFMFSGFNAAWFFWAHVDTAVWTPWVLYTVYKYINTMQNKHLIGVTLSMLMLNLGGFPMVAVMTYISAAIMVFIFLISKRSSFKEWVRVLIYLTIFSLLAVLIALPFIYPLIELFEFMGGTGYRSCGAGFSKGDFALFYNPDLYKIPRVETTFYVGVLPLVFLVFTFIFSFFRPSFIAIFSLLLFLFALTISFALIDIDIIRAIPLLNSSLLTRFGYLLGLALAIISAYGLHILYNKFQDYKWIYILIAILFSIQIAQQKDLFSDFNGPVPNASFYPKTKSISYLQEHLKPLEHIMADSGYLIAGTLGGYALNDWYAHSFHKGQEKEILRKIVNKPFKTPTSSMFNFSQINLDSPYIDYLGIKSILTTNFSQNEYVMFWDNNRKRKPCPTIPANTLLQKFSLSKPYNITGIQLYMATYGEKHASSDVELILKKDENIIATLIADKMSINDNKWVSFKLNTSQILDTGKYSMSIQLKESTNAKPLTVWSNIGENRSRLLVNGKETDLSFQMRFIAHKTLNPKYNILNLEPNIHILENKNVKENAYFLKTLDKKYSPDYTPIKTQIFSNTKIKITYLGSDSGWVIFPMHKYPGWTATVNGKKTKIDTFLGMMPAVKINTKSDILLSYKPTYNKYTYPLSILSILILIFAALRFRKKD